MKKILLWFDSPVGTGHIGAMSQLSKDLKQQGLDVYIASGSFHGARNHKFCDEAHFIELPPVYLGDGDSYVSEKGIELSKDADWQEAYNEKLLGAYKKIQPDALLFEMWPIGRQKCFDNVLLDLVKETQSQEKTPPLYCLSRDIIKGQLTEADMPSHTRSSKVINENIDKVYVRGDGSIPLSDTYGGTRLIQDKIKYIGYIAPNIPQKKQIDDADREIIVTASTLKDAEAFYRLVLSSYNSCNEELRSHPWRVLVSDACDDNVLKSLQDVAKACGGNITVERTRPDFMELLANAHLLVSQGGSTLPQAVACSVPSMTIPSAWSGNHNEQAFRAQTFADKGYTVKCDFHEYSNHPEKLADELEKAAHLELNGFMAKGGAAIAADITNELNNKQSVLEEAGLLRVDGMKPISY